MPKTRGDCDPAAERLRELRDMGQKNYSCLQISTPTESTPEEILQRSGDAVQIGPTLVPDLDPAGFPTNACAFDNGRPHDRYTLCVLKQLTLETRDSATGNLVGWGKAQGIFFVKFQKLTRNFDVGFKWNMYDASGVLATNGGGALWTSPTCLEYVEQGECTMVSSGQADDVWTPFAKNTQLAGNWVMNSKNYVNPADESAPVAGIGLWWTPPEGAGVPVTDLVSFDFPDDSTTRCDAFSYLNAPSGGCVFSSYVPVIIWSLTGAAPENARHVMEAMEAIYDHPGREGDGYPLIRDTPGSQEPKRAAMCASFFPERNGDTCDEYPFASTQQGGDPDYGSIASITADDNSAGGGIINKFYTDHRIAVGDEFWVRVVQWE